MLELIKLITDLFVLRDSAQKGMMSWKVMLTGFAFAAFLFGTLLPAFLYYQNHPAAKPLFIAVLVIDAIAYVAMMVLGWRWYARGAARYEARQAEEAARQESSAQ
jgi:type VI protein secretion system component VasK